MGTPSVLRPQALVLPQEMVPPQVALPILLFDDECSVCRHIASWVVQSAKDGRGAATLVVRGIGEDPEELQGLRPPVDIWAAYETVHLLMPDATTRLGGEAVAEILRRLPNCRWFAWVFSLSVLGRRPAQFLLDLAYRILADLRPVLGCESCGTFQPWVRPLMRIRAAVRYQLGYPPTAPQPPGFNALPVGRSRPAS